MSKKETLSISFDSKIFNNYPQLLKHLQSLLSKENPKKDVSDKIKFLASFKNMLVKGQHNMIYDHILSTNFHQFLIDRMKICIENKDIDLMRAILSSIITITDNSKLLCETFYNTELPNILINQTLYYCAEECQSKLPKKVSIEDIIGQFILIVHNIARHDQYQQYFFDHEKLDLFKENISQFLYSKDKRMLILTMAVLTWLAKDNSKDTFLLGLRVDIIDNFIDYINKGMKDKDRWFEGLDVWELLLVLQALSCMETVQQKICITPKLVTMLKNIFQSKYSLTNEILISLGILWNLLFVDNNNRQSLIMDFKIEDSIRNLLQSKNESVRKKASNVLWELLNEKKGKSGEKEMKTEILKKKIENEIVSVKKGTVYDIFISYCHAQNSVVEKIFKELKNKFKVWIDKEGIKGSGLDDMAAGIEQSKIILMGVSNSYKQSQCCHSEANYAYRLKKPFIPLLMERKYKPDGWLGMMICTETYIDVSNIDENIDSCLKSIEEHIYHKCNDFQTINITVMISNEETKSCETENKKIDEKLKPLKEWSVDEVSNWFIDNGLSDFHSKLPDCNGKMLEAMKNMKINAYNEYLNHIKEVFKPDFGQILKLDSAISDI